MELEAVAQSASSPDESSGPISDGAITYSSIIVT